MVLGLVRAYSVLFGKELEKQELGGSVQELEGVALSSDIASAQVGRLQSDVSSYAEHAALDLGWDGSSDITLVRTFLDKAKGRGERSLASEAVRRSLPIVLETTVQNPSSMENIAAVHVEPERRLNDRIKDEHSQWVVRWSKGMEIDLRGIYYNSEVFKI